MHIHSLVAELKANIIGASFKEAEFYKKQREAYLHFKNDKATLALGLVYHPQAFGAFMIPRGKVQMETSEKPWPFFQPALEGVVVEVAQYDFDRIFRIILEKEGERFTIVVEAIGPNGNFWLLDANDKIMATLRNKKFEPGEVYTPPPAPDKLNPRELELRHLIELFRRSDQSVENTIRKNILGLDKVLTDEILERAGMEHGEAACALKDEQLEVLEGKIKRISGFFDDYSSGYFFAHETGNLAYPFKLRICGEEGVKCKSLSFAVYTAIRTRRAERSEASQMQTVITAVERHIKKLMRKIRKVEEDFESAGNFEQYRKYAELIQIYIPKIEKGSDYAELIDVYGSGKPIVIELDPSLSPAQNAEVYFKKYRKGKDALDLLKRRLEIAKRELEAAQVMYTEIETSYNEAVLKYEAELAGIIPAAAERRIPVVRLPYKDYTLSSGVTIFVGRDGADNDSTTFGYAKPYELWFHTSQCPGSHVVMKFPDKNFVPSKGEIAETAAIAAYHSKARNSKTVPVIYTQKKYVRKPRKAKPGLVTVEREKLVMVEPKAPE
nr:NFACT family protein [candidate division Zixibacteria bacterium]